MRGALDPPWNPFLFSTLSISQILMTHSNQRPEGVNQGRIARYAGLQMQLDLGNFELAKNVT